MDSSRGIIAVVVAAETQLLRELLCRAMNEENGIRVAATAPDSSRALALAQNLEADVVVVSVTMADSAILIRALLDRHARVVALGPCDEHPVAVVEDGTIHDIVAAVHGAMHGAFSSHLLPAGDFDHLTPSERRVLEAVNEGRSNKEIAREMGIAIPTVKHHVHSVLTKLGVSRRGEAAALYRRTEHPSSRRPRPPTAWSLRSGAVRTS